jgi:hypothetical protein
MANESNVLKPVSGNIHKEQTIILEQELKFAFIQN